MHLAARHPRAPAHRHAGGWLDDPRAPACMPASKAGCPYSHVAPTGAASANDRAFSSSRLLTVCNPPLTAPSTRGTRASMGARQRARQGGARQSTRYVSTVRAPPRLCGVLAGALCPCACPTPFRGRRGRRPGGQAGRRAGRRAERATAERTRDGGADKTCAAGLHLKVRSRAWQGAFWTTSVRTSVALFLAFAMAFASSCCSRAPALPLPGSPPPVPATRHVRNEGVKHIACNRPTARMAASC